MIKFLLAFLLFIPSVLADTLTFDWSPPLDVSMGVTGYKLYVSSTAGVYGTTPDVTVAYPATTTTLVKTTLGKFYAVMTAYNAAGQSPYSNEVTFTIAQKVPGAPRTLSFTQQ